MYQGQPNMETVVKYFPYYVFSNMGGVDKIDALLGFYRTFFRSRKWFHRIFFHFMDVCLVNAWLVYRRDMKETASVEKPLTLYLFKAAVSEVLRKQNQPIMQKPRMGRPFTPQPDPARGYKRKLPQDEVIVDQMGHFPGSNSLRKRCKNTSCIGKTTTFCLKCKVHLCITSFRNCFCDFHGIDPDQYD
ncbi:unnamed protein product, partial [Meganyctiphanes norvegica]